MDSVNALWFEKCNKPDYICNNSLKVEQPVVPKLRKVTNNVVKNAIVDKELYFDDTFSH